MLLIIHLSIAFSSLAVTGLNYLSPSSKRLKVSYGLIALTLLTGSALVVLSQASLMHACLSGLAYTAVTIFGSAISKNKLATQANPLK